MQIINIYVFLFTRFVVKHDFYQFLTKYNF